MQQVVVGGRVEDSAWKPRPRAPPRSRSTSPRRLGLAGSRRRARGGAPPRPCAASALSRGSDGRNTQLICSPRPGVRRMKRPTTWRKNSSVRAARRVDADAQARDVDALGDHQHGHEPRLARRGEARRSARDASGSSEVTTGGRGAGDAREPVGEPLGVLLVGGDDEPAGVRVLAGAQVAAAGGRRRAAPAAIQSPSGSSAVRSRRAASAAGSTTEKSAWRRRPSRHPLHVAVVGQNVTGRQTRSCSACV